ncbi:hypothetical protein [Achromobacter sp.]|uniref:hypothetical protein n=1 Tax=Achromobacter sp. TaxID=134375 RepID=UPI00258FB571|nr:hypothetical protein [Achromobacter sp.]
MKTKKNAMNIYQAACSIVNDVIQQATRLNALGFRLENCFFIYFDLEEIEKLVSASFGTLDGNPSDLEMVAKLAHYILSHHIEAGDISTVTFVEPKGRGEGWTSHHAT